MKYLEKSITNRVDGTFNRQVIYLEYITDIGKIDIQKLIEKYSLPCIWVKIIQNYKEGFLCLAALDQKRVKKIYLASHSSNKDFYLKKGFVHIRTSEKKYKDRLDDILTFTIINFKKSKIIKQFIFSRPHLNMVNFFLDNPINIAKTYLTGNEENKIYLTEKNE